MMLGYIGKIGMTAWLLGAIASMAGGALEHPQSAAQTAVQRAPDAGDVIRAASAVAAGERGLVLRGVAAATGLKLPSLTPRDSGEQPLKSGYACESNGLAVWPCPYK